MPNNRVVSLSRSRIVLRNIASNWIGFAVQAAVLFFVTPFVLRDRGDTRYGVWVLTTTMTGYYGLLAFGMTGGITQYITRYLAVRDFGKMNEAASTAFVTLVGLGALVFSSSFFLAWLAPYVFNIPVEHHDEVAWCIIIVGTTVALQFSFFLFSAVLVATQRYDLSNLVGVTSSLLGAGFVFLALRQGYGLVGLCLAKSVSELIGYLLRWSLARRVLPQLAISRGFINVSTLRLLMSYGTWSFIISIAGSIFAQIDAMVIGIFMPMVAVSRYALAAGVSIQMSNVLRPIDRVFFPTLTDLHAKGDLAGLRSLYLRGSRLYLVVVAVCVTIACCWADDFFRLWIGPQYVENSDDPSVPFLFVLLTVALVGRLLPGLGGQVLQAAVLVRPLANLAILEATANVLLSIWFVHLWGLSGVALATIVSVVTIRTFFVPFLVSRFLGVSVAFYLRDAVARPIIVGIAIYPCALGIRQLGTPLNFVELVLQGLAATVAASFLAAYVGLTRREREQYVYAPLRRIGIFREQKDCIPPSAQQHSEKSEETVGTP